MDRRQFITRGATLTAGMWAAPQLQSVAHAQTGANGTPPVVECPECPNCQAQATGLSALGLTAGTASGTGCECLLNVNLSEGSIGGASAQTVCGRADDATCTASSYLEGLVVRIAENARLEATVLSSCVSCGTGTATIARLDLVTTTLGVETRTQLDVTTGCNVAIVVPGFENLVAVVFNEQSCDNGTLTVNALRVTIARLNVIAGQSKAGGPGCPCQPCATNPTCTPPTSRLC